MWSAKGGVGCTVAASAISLLLARTRQVLLVDLGGDVSAVLGRSDDGPGIAHWLATEDPPPDALSRLEIETCTGLSVLPWGAAGPPPSPRPSDGPEMLAMMLGLDHRTVVVDVGLRNRAVRAPEVAEQMLRLSSRSTLVIRPCRLALRAAEKLSRPDDVVMIGSGRAVRPRDVEAAVGAPVVARLGWDPAVARSVDAGLLRARMPRSLRPLAAASA